MHLRHRWLVALVATVGASGSAVAQDGFWTEAAKPYEGVTIRGVSESTPPSNYVKDVLAPQFTKETGIKVEFETTSWDQMYDKAIKDMEANTGIYDFVYIEQDIIYSYLSRNFLVDMTSRWRTTRSSRRPTSASAEFTSFIDYFKDPKTGDSTACRWRPSSRSTCTARTCSRTRRPRRRSRRSTATTWRRPRPSPSTSDNRRVLHAPGARRTTWSCGARRSRRSPGHPASFYEFFEIDRAELRRLQLGHQPGDWRAIGRERRQDEQRQGQGGADVLARPAEVCAARGDLQHLGRGRGLVRRRPRRAGLGLRRERRLDRDRRQPLQRRRQGRRGAAADGRGRHRGRRAGEGYIGYYDGGAFGIPHSSKNKEAALLWLQYIGQPSVQARLGGRGGADRTDRHL